MLDIKSKGDDKISIKPKLAKELPGKILFPKNNKSNPIRFTVNSI